VIVSEIEKPLRLLDMLRRRVGGISTLPPGKATFGMHDHLLAAGAGRMSAAPRRHAASSRSCAEILGVEVERRFAGVLIEQIGLEHRFSPFASLGSEARYFSVSFFRLTRPASKSLPIHAVIFMKTCISLK